MQAALGRGLAVPKVLEDSAEAAEAFQVKVGSAHKRRVLLTEWSTFSFSPDRVGRELRLQGIQEPLQVERVHQEAGEWELANRTRS